MPLTPEARTESVDRIFESARIIPVMQIYDLDEAVPMAQALVDGGLTVLEITLRSEVALQAIENIIDQVEGAIVGAGTVLNPEQLRAVVDTGAQFAISPGATPELYEAAAKFDIPLIPGVATSSEIMLGLSHGYSRFKFFPAIAAGGLSMLKSWQSPFAGVRFCPTGGITATTAGDFLMLPNVMGVGGSWMFKKEILENQDWSALESLARDCTTHF